MADRSGVEIDYCPECRGVWLDRGELDKIIDRSTSDTRNYQDSGSRDRQYSQKETNYKRKKKSLLGELFDF
jgi:Zn-finger nucleic acid-binding protein